MEVATVGGCREADIERVCAPAAAAPGAAGLVVLLLELLLAEMRLMAEDLDVLSARLKEFPPMYPFAPPLLPCVPPTLPAVPGRGGAPAVVLELLGLRARNADAIEGERPWILAVMLCRRSRAILLPPPDAPVPLLLPMTPDVAVRVLDVDLRLPFRLATIPAPPTDDEVDGLRRRVESRRGGNSPILPWWRNSSPARTSSGAVGISALSCALRSCSDMPQTQKSCDCPCTGVAVLGTLPCPFVVIVGNEIALFAPLFDVDASTEPSPTLAPAGG